MNASNRSLRVLALLVLAIAAGWVLWPRERREASPVPAPVDARRDTVTETPHALAVTTSSAAEMVVPATSAEPEKANIAATTMAPNEPDGGNANKPDNTTALTAIEAAVVRYDASALPLIDPYLLHADPEVREAARDGMVQVGDAAAARYLRAAADKVKDPREAVALLDAADYVELPAALPVKKREGAPRAAPPNPHVSTETARPR